MIGKVLQQEDINFLLTNRIPRRWLTHFMGWFSRLEHPWIRDCSIALWRLFADVDLREAKKTHFDSLHDGFTRELKAGARAVCKDTAVVVSPCDALVGAIGQVSDGTVLQAKGCPYRLEDLLGDTELVRYYAAGSYATLRLTAGMYHRFHAPYDCRVEQVTYVSGDTWNVNAIALKRVAQLFCKNERAIIRCQLMPTGQLITLVPVAAILVASIRLHFLDVLLHLQYRGPNVIACDATLRKGQEMGWFEHGSTIIVFAPRGFSFCSDIRDGVRIRMGQPLLGLPHAQRAVAGA
jgi:phosphatidylserine decarboxylase